MFKKLLSRSFFILNFKGINFGFDPVSPKNKDLKIV